MPAAWLAGFKKRWHCQHVSAIERACDDGRLIQVNVTGLQ
jgi:hypothetical protein